MASFFEKLKRGMGVEEPAKENEEAVEKSTDEKIVEKIKKPKKKGKYKTERKSTEVKAEKLEDKETEKQTIEKKEVSKISIAPVPAEVSPAKDTEEKPEKKGKWSALNGEAEGQLAVDVYQTEDELVIQSAIAGVKPENLDISIEEDMISIKGSREKSPEEREINYFYQECFWGPFSRKIILPVEADAGRAEATMKEGILTIRMPKIQKEKKRKIIVKE